MGEEIVCVIPAWNEERSIGGVVSEALTATPNVTVINDGSTDRTAEVAMEAGATVISHAVNLGVCGALRTGLLHATRQGASVVLQVDGDGQHPVEAAMTVLSVLQDTGSDLVIGSRFSVDSGYRVSSIRQAGMALLRRSTQLMTGREFTDPSSGLRAFSGRLAQELSRNFPDHFLSDTYEVLCAAVRAGYEVHEVPVTMRCRQFGESSAGNLTASLRVARSVLAVHTGLGFRLERRPVYRSFGTNEERDR